MTNLEPLSRFEQFSLFLSDEITNGVGLIALVLVLAAQAIWHLYIHVRRREFFPKIEYLCDALFKAQTETHWIVEVVCVIRNKGISGHKASSLNFRVHGLSAGDALVDGSEKINSQLYFPHLIKQGVWQHRKDLNDLIEAGTTQYYRHITAIPKNKFVAIIVHGSMKYPQTRAGKLVEHTCNRLVKVPVTDEEAAAYAFTEIDRLQFANEPPRFVESVR